VGYVLYLSFEFWTQQVRVSLDEAVFFGSLDIVAGNAMFYVILSDSRIPSWGVENCSRSAEKAPYETISSISKAQTPEP